MNTSISMHTREQLTFDEYQQQAGKTAIYPYRDVAINYSFHAAKLERASTDLPPAEASQIIDDLRTVNLSLTQLLAQCYVVLGLSSEAGEVAGVLKKAIRDGTPPLELSTKINKELGDVQWYAAEAATLFGFTLGSCASANLVKLSDRSIRGFLKGSGDNR